MGNRPFQSPPIISTANGAHFCLSRVPLQAWIKGVDSFTKIYPNVMRVNTEQLTELLSGAGIPGDSCKVLFKAFNLLPQESGDSKDVTNDADIDEFICAAVLLSSGHLEEKLSFLVGRKDAQRLGWANSIGVFLLLLAAVRGMHRFVELWSPTPAALRDFVAAYEPHHGHWTASELLRAVRQDPYGSNYLDNLEKPHSMDDVRQEQMQGWKRYEKALVRLRRQWAIRSRADKKDKDDDHSKDNIVPTLPGGMNPMFSIDFGGAGSSKPGGTEKAEPEDTQEEFIYEDTCVVLHEVAPMLDPEALIEAHLLAEKQCFDLSIPFEAIGSPEKIGKQVYYRSMRRPDVMKILDVAIAFIALDRPGYNVVSAAYYPHLCALLRERSEFFNKLPDHLELIPGMESASGASLRLREWCIHAGAWCIVELRQQMAQELRNVFMRYDADNSGSIDREEFEAIVRELMFQIITPSEDQMAACNEIAQGIADEILDSADFDDSGHVEYAEFWNCVQHIMSKQGELVHALKTATTLEQVQKMTNTGKRRQSRVGANSSGLLSHSSSNLLGSAVPSRTSVRKMSTQPSSDVLADLEDAFQKTKSEKSRQDLHGEEDGNAEVAFQHTESRKSLTLGDQEKVARRGSWIGMALSGGKRSSSKERKSLSKDRSEVVPISPAGKRGSLIGAREARSSTDPRRAG